MTRQIPKSHEFGYIASCGGMCPTHDRGPHCSLALVGLPGQRVATNSLRIYREPILASRWSAVNKLTQTTRCTRYQVILAVIIAPSYHLQNASRTSLPRLLEILPQDLAQIAVLKLEGYLNREIADELKCHEGTVERKLQVIRLLWQEQL